MVAQINRYYLEEFTDIQVVKVFRNGKKALEFLRQTPVDLVILDVYMPELSGLELLRNMRQLTIHADVIMVTAANATHYVDEMLRLGIVDYLVKPFEYERFRNAVEKYLQRKNLLCSHSTLSQQSIDWIVKSGGHKAGSSLQKGLQEPTLSLVLKSLQQTPQCYFSCEDLSSRTGLSKVTVRRYLNHLRESRLIDCVVDYETGGRPSMKYRLAL